VPNDDMRLLTLAIVRPRTVLDFMVKGKFGSDGVMLLPN
jgi:hypothetical protein